MPSSHYTERTNAEHFHHIQCTKIRNTILVFLKKKKNNDMKINITYEILMIFMHLYLNFIAWFDHLDLLKTGDIWLQFLPKWWIFMKPIDKRKCNELLLFPAVFMLLQAEVVT